MAPPSSTQRLDQLEEQLKNLQTTMAEQLANAVEQAAAIMKQSLSEQIAMSFKQTSKQLRVENGEKVNSRCGYGGGYDVGGYQAGGGASRRFKEPDLPIFDGTDPHGWILRAERFFSFYGLTDDEKMEASVVALDGNALHWFQWENKRHPIRRWEEMKGLLLRHFRATGAESLCEQWLARSQTGDVVEYQRKFIELLAPLEGVSDQLATGKFLTGLSKEIRAEVRLLNPKTLDQAMDLALKVEEKLQWRA